MSGIKLARALEVAQTAVRAAGRFLLDSRGRIGSAALEGRAPREVVANIEREAEALIRSRIGAVFPEHGFVGADLGGTFDARRAQWLVDALDGTDNYLHGYPQYAVSLALQHQGEAVLGVIYDPHRDELFSATRGQGAYCNGTRLACSMRAVPEDALVATMFPPPNSECMSRFLEEFARVTNGCGGVRRSGALALDLAYLAAGRVDAFWAHDVGAWDAAAAIVLLRESGARVESLDNSPLPASRSLLAAAPSLLAPTRALLAGST